ncbi:hypothetical protein HK097_002203, partial [Rhizophlyctis rosea]
MYFPRPSSLYRYPSQEWMNYGFSSHPTRPRSTLPDVPEVSGENVRRSREQSSRRSRNGVRKGAMSEGSWSDGDYLSFDLSSSDEALYPPRKNHLPKKLSIPPRSPSSPSQLSPNQPRFLKSLTRKYTHILQTLSDTSTILLTLQTHLPPFIRSLITTFLIPLFPLTSFPLRLSRYIFGPTVSQILLFLSILLLQYSRKPIQKALTQSASHPAGKEFLGLLFAMGVPYFLWSIAG